MSKEPKNNGPDIEYALTDTLNNVSNMIQCLDVGVIETAARMIAESDIVVTFGNGGSYAVASHFAGDLMLHPGPFVYTVGDNAVASIAYSNDYSFEQHAELMVQRIETNHMRNEITLVVFSTSGKSENVIRAAAKAKALNWRVIAMLGRDSTAVKPYADLVIPVYGDKAGRIEAVHDTVCHAIAEVVPILVLKEWLNNRSEVGLL